MPLRRQEETSDIVIGLAREGVLSHGQLLDKTNGWRPDLTKELRECHVFCSLV